MPRRALRRALTAAATAVSALALGLAAPGAHAATPLPYVALGDSYSAGSGVLPADLSAPLLCLRSTLNYPHVVAERTGAALTDVTCGAAETGDITEAQYPGVPAQLDAVKSDTRLVTLTIGGNDNNTFVGAMLACGTAGLATLGHGHPCETLYGSTFDDQIDDTTYPAVKAALRAIRDKAPNARVAVLGYPWIMPAAADGSCFVKMPIASGDVPYLRTLQAHLNTVIQRAARETGAGFVDFSKTSDGHDACASSGSRWIEPLLFGTNVVPVHPNARGERAMAEQTMTALGLG
ncbi:lysophospholipase L1-like esterase [Streptomyces sp. B3I7]|uniref:SGNH/GDSL hydrolase family protein n=1 Tax=Streptomyces sp. B3I7 TaxID=3042269 RepID=UPI002780AC4D|nr:SGNH/GDSL hydrolase family protein [Streptomyces sp. B3I7]MDQ0809097.1 lysophospholipase L1-like esterase [Streptomyces sp. B3I7]